jgi:alpha-L-rhamnosidase
VFRRTFSLQSAVRRATLYASARGLVELRIGGRRVSEDLFAPEWTDYLQRIHYRTYEVTALLGSGPQELSVALGDGWWSGYVGWQEQRGRYGSLENSVLLQLEIRAARRQSPHAGHRWLVAVHHGADPLVRLHDG